LRSAILDFLTGKSGPRGATPDTYGYGMTGAYGERYEPESRQELVDAYFDRVWVNRCVNLISSSATQVPMQVKVRGEWIEEHKMLDLLRRPSPRDPALMFFEWTIKWAEVIGEWFWEIVPSRGGDIAQLFPLRGQFVRIKPGEGGTIEGYSYDPNVNGVDVVQFDALDPYNPKVSGEGEKSIVVAGRYANPKDDLYGMSPLRAAKDDIISEYFGVRYDHRFFRNAARPDLVIGFKGKMDSEERKLNKEEWAEFKGVDRAHRAAILSGDPDITLLTQSQKDVEYLEGRRLAREGQCAAFGVPPVLVGDMTRATYSNFENAEPIFWKITMLPKLGFFATWTKVTLMPFYPDVEDFRFDTTVVPALARAEGWRSERAAKEVSGGLKTPNEGRGDLGDDPIEEAGADSLWMPTKSRPIVDLIEAAPTPQLEEEPGVNVPKARPGYRLESWVLRESKTTVTEWLRNALEAKARFSERGKMEIVKHFAEQRDRVLSIVEGQEKAAELERLLSEYGWSDDAANFHQVVETMQEGLALASFKITAEAVDQAASESLIARTLKALANRPEGIASVSGRVKNEVLEEVREGIAHGLTYRQIAEGGTFTSTQAGAPDVTIKGIKGVYEEYTTWQAERIARTEAAVTFNQSSAGLMREAGIESVDIMDGDEDEECADANGSRWTLEEYEANPISHPNCTRIGLPVIEVPK
jgi:HK97 family phage portal protein